MPYVNGYPAASAISVDDLIPILQGASNVPGTGTTRRATLSQILGGAPGFQYLPLIGGAVTGLTTFSGAGTGLAVTNNQIIGGTLGVTGASTFSGTLGVAGALSLTKVAGIGLAVTAGATVGTTFTAGTSVKSPNIGSAAGTSLIISPGGNGRTITFGDPAYGIGSIATMTMSAGAMSMLLSGQMQAVRFTTGVNAYAPASAALTPLILSGASVTGTVVGAGAFNIFSVASDTADFTAAADNSGKVINVQYNFGAGAAGARTGIWAQMNPVSLTHVIDMVAVSANITANSNMAGSFLQPIASIAGVRSGASNVGHTLNEFDYYSEIAGVGIKGALIIALARGDLYQGDIDASLIFVNSNNYGISQGMKALVSLGNTNQGFPLGTNGSVLTVLPQVANQGLGQDVQFIRMEATAGIDIQYINFTAQSGYSYRAPGFWVDGTGQVRAAQGLVLGRSGTSQTIDVPSTFAVNSVVPASPGTPTVAANSSRGNYYPNDIVNGNGNPKGQYLITECQLLAAAITAGGTGGTPGAAVVTLVGGSGVAATVNVTIGAGGNITSVNSVASVGTYTAFFGNLDAIPVTGGGLTGATLACGFGAKTLTVLVPDVFATNITAITTTGGSGAGLTLTGTNQTRNGLSVMPTSGGLIGFYGATPVAKQTGVAVTAAGIHAALTSLGLIAP